MSLFPEGFALGFGGMIAVLLALWAVAGEIRERRERRPRRLHSKRDSQERTRRLYTPQEVAQAQRRRMVRDGGQAQRLPAPEDYPQPSEGLVAGHDDRPLDQAPPPWPYIHPEGRHRD